MVTKGYQKGVYDRVTEGTWVWERSHQSPAKAVPLVEEYREGPNGTVAGGGSGSRDGGEDEDQEAKDGGPREASQYVPDHDAHRANPPRGGDRE
jgi:hypothetical protein